jgi:hypothetical protein
MTVNKQHTKVENFSLIRLKLIMAIFYKDI